MYFGERSGMEHRDWIWKVIHLLLAKLRKPISRRAVLLMGNQTLVKLSLLPISQPQPFNIKALEKS